MDRERYDKFTERARKVLSLAQEEAQRFQHNYIETEHLLLGLVREEEGVAAKVLSNLGVELNKVRSAVEFILSVKAHIVPEQVGLTPQVKKVIELAVDEARLLNHHYVGIEHLLLGLIREEKGTAASVLESLGVTLEKARIETMRVLSQPALLQKMEVPPQLKDALEALDTLLREKEAALLHHEYGLAAELTAREVNLRDRIARLESDWYRERDNKESGQQPIQDDDDKVQELSQAEKDFLQTLGVFSQDDRDRFEKFTVRARRVLRFSREEAERFQHNYIGTEHLLLGLVRENGGIAAAVLRNLGVELTKVRDAVEFIIGRGDHIVPGQIGLTPRAKAVIEIAADEARRLNHDYIGTEHLLLGLVREGEGIAAGVLQDALPKRRGRPLRSAPKPCVRLVASHGSSRMQSVVTDTPCRVWHAFGRGNVGEERTCC